MHRCNKMHSQVLTLVLKIFLDQSKEVMTHGGDNYDITDVSFPKGN